MKRVALLLLLALGGTATAAQKASDADLRRSATIYGVCVIEGSPAQAEAYILDDMSQIQGLRKGVVQKMMDPACVNRAAEAGGISIRFPGDSYRYALAEGLIKRHRIRIDWARLREVPPLSHHSLEADYDAEVLKGMSAEEAKRSLAIAAGYRMLSIYGECVVRADPANSLALAESTVESSNEYSAFESLASALSGCFNGGQASFNKFNLKGAISVNLVRLSAKIKALPPEPVSRDVAPQPTAGDPNA
jgi:hypothetical protein